MPTNRPFFANFFAVFRAHSAVTKASSASTSSNITTTASSTPSSPFATQTVPGSAARTINTKASASNQVQTSPGATTAAVQAASQHLRQASTSPQPQTHAPSSFGGRHTSQSPLQSPASPTRTSGWARRRGSDSSSDSGGFREVLGAEKWYVGGRTAGGEERFLALKMVRKEGSWERRSADQLSL